MEIDIINQISAYFGLKVESLLAMAVGITVVVNYFKASAPFNKWVTGDTIPYVTGILALITSSVTFWDNRLQLIAAAVLITVLSIGGWATAKMMAHKAGTTPTNTSGGG